METTKNICCAKDKGTVDHHTQTRLLKKFYMGRKNFNDQARFGNPKIVSFKTVLQAIETNWMSISRDHHLTVQCGSSPSPPYSCFYLIGILEVI